MDRLFTRIVRSLAARFRTWTQRFERRIIELELAKHSLSHATGIRTWTTLTQLESLYRLAAQIPDQGNIVELGSYLGASTCFLIAGAALRDGRVVAIDTWQNETIPEGPRDTFAEFQKNIAGARDRLKIVRKNTSELTAEDIGTPVHMAFIDADHSYDATRRDFAFLAPHIAPGGIVAFHDTTSFEGVGRVLGEALSSGEWCMAGHQENITWIRRATWAPWPSVASPAK